MVKIDIITINLNNANGLLKTIQFNLSQKYKSFNSIIIDGGSTDESISIIEKHIKNNHFVISEKDFGVYNAMNKGIRAATGDYIIFMNSGDCFYDDDVLQEFADSAPTEDLIYGNVKWTDGEVITEGRFPSVLTYDFFLHQALHHQSLFIKRSLFEKTGLYREDIPIVADWAHELDSIVKHNASYRYWDRFISISPRDGMSCNPANFDRMAETKRKYLTENYGFIQEEYERRLRIQTELEAIKNRKIFRFMKKLGLS